jgi:hypothetical protein
MKTMLHLLFAISFGCFAGCATNGTAPPPAQSGSAVLFTNGSFWNVPKANMKIVSIDGRSTSVRQASLATGLHIVDVSFRTGDYNGFATVPCDLKVGGVYEISADIESGRSIKVTLDRIKDGTRSELHSHFVNGVAGP